MQEVKLLLKKFRSFRVRVFRQIIKLYLLPEVTLPIPASVPYTDAMKLSELQLRIKAVRGSKNLDFDPVKLADGVIATSTLVEKHGKTIIMKDNFARIIPETQMADINYHD